MRMLTNWIELLRICSFLNKRNPSPPTANLRVRGIPTVWIIDLCLSTPLHEPGKQSPLLLCWSPASNGLAKIDLWLILDHKFQKSFLSFLNFMSSRSNSYKLGRNSTTLSLPIKRQQGNLLWFRCYLVNHPTRGRPTPIGWMHVHLLTSK